LDLASQRLEVQRIDEQIVRLIARRMDMAGNILRAKAAIGAVIEDTGQEALVIDRACRWAASMDLDEEDVKAIFGILIRMSKERQMAIAAGLKPLPIANDGLMV
jgi:chorismate mutase